MDLLMLIVLNEPIDVMLGIVLCGVYLTIVLCMSIVGTNSYGRRAFSYTRPQFGTKFQNMYEKHHPVMSFRKQLKTYYFGHLLRPPDGYVMSCPELL